MNFFKTTALFSNYLKVNLKSIFHEYLKFSKSLVIFSIFLFIQNSKLVKIVENMYFCSFHIQDRYRKNFLYI